MFVEWVDNEWSRRAQNALKEVWDNLPEKEAMQAMHNEVMNRCKENAKTIYAANERSAMEAAADKIRAWTAAFSMISLTVALLFGVIFARKK